jgi:hypothetical protein
MTRNTLTSFRVSCPSGRIRTQPIARTKLKEAPRFGGALLFSIFRDARKIAYGSTEIPGRGFSRKASFLRQPSHRQSTNFARNASMVACASRTSPHQHPASWWHVNVFPQLGHFFSIVADMLAILPQRRLRGILFGARNIQQQKQQEQSSPENCAVGFKTAIDYRSYV